MLILYLSERMMGQFRSTPFERDFRHATSTLNETLPGRVAHTSLFVSFGVRVEPLMVRPMDQRRRRSRGARIGHQS
jgi:hypothetical protein